MQHLILIISLALVAGWAQDATAQETKPGILNAISNAENENLREVVTSAPDSTFVDMELPTRQGHIRSDYAYRYSTDKLTSDAYVVPLWADQTPARHKQRASAPKHSGNPAGDAPQAVRQSKVKSDKQFQQAMRAGLEPLQHCWQRALLTGATSAEIELYVTLAANGRVERVQHLGGDDVGGPEFDKCLMHTAKRLRTATPPGERVFLQVPLQFSAN